jgi:hypothetical protein
MPYPLGHGANCFVKSRS